MSIPGGSKQSLHQWKFFRAGGFDQVRLTNGADIAALPDLDQKLWMALAAPATHVEFDLRTLALLDTDKDGRIRVTEVISAIEWMKKCLHNLDTLVAGGTSLPLSDINEGTDEGKQVLASAKRILSNLGKPDATQVDLADVSDTSAILSQTRLNGDGIIPPEAVEGPVAVVIEEIIKTVGSEVDRAGKAGVSAALVEAFFGEIALHDAWLDQGKNDSAILALGADTAAAYGVYVSLRDKLADYFTRTQLAAYEARAGDKLRPSDEEYTLLGRAMLSTQSDGLAQLPLAAVEAGRALPLTGDVNPAWAERLLAFQKLVVQPLLGDKAALTATDFATIKAKLTPYETWQATMSGQKVASLGEARIKELVTGPQRKELEDLVAADKALEPEITNIEQVEKLVRCKRDFFSLLNNFVSFTDFYQRKGKSIFQAGSLFLDQRSCDLCIHVDDIGKHATLASLSRMYLAYCEVSRRGSNEKKTIVAAFTNGDSDNLMVGRNGVFYDRTGKDWDATIVKIVDNPISIRQAFFAPYKKFAALIEAQVQKFAASKDNAMHEAASSNIAAGATAVETAKPPAAPFDVAKFAGIFAAIGLAIGAISGAIGALLSAFMQLAWWQMPIAIAGLVLVVSGPSMLMAWLKLRQRNLGPILDANGWAVNSQAKVNLPLGEALTDVATLPPGSDVDTFDAFAEKKAGRKWVLFGVFLALAAYLSWQTGLVAQYVSQDLPKPAWLKERQAAEAKEAKERAEKEAADKAAAEKAKVKAEADAAAAKEKAASEKAAEAQRSENAPTPSGKPTATPIPAPATAPLSAENKAEAKKPLAEPIKAPAAAPSATPATK